MSFQYVNYISRSVNNWTVSVIGQFFDMLRGRGGEAFQHSNEFVQHPPPHLRLGSYGSELLDSASSIPVRMVPWLKIVRAMIKTAYQSFEAE